MINIDVLQSAHPRHLGPIRDCRFMDEERTRIALVNYTVRFGDIDWLFLRKELIRVGY